VNTDRSVIQIRLPENETRCPAAIISQR